MADNKLLLRRDADQDFLADDDPLAELARIVGFDGGSATKPAAPQRREPAFDLEDELLKELEIYAQPTPPEAETAAVPSFEPVAVQPNVPPQPEPVMEPVVADLPVEDVVPVEAAEPAVVRAPVVLEAVETYADVSEGRVYERPASHPVFDLEDEILREFAAFDARRIVPHEQKPVEAELVHQQAPAAAEFGDDVNDLQISAQAAIEGRGLYDSFLGDDLDAAISQAADPHAETAPVVVSHAHHAPIEDRIEPVFEPAANAVSSQSFDAPPVTADMWPAEAEVRLSAELTDLPTDDIAVGEERDREMVAAPAVDVAEQADAEPILPAVPVVTAAAPSASIDYGLDDLLAEVERYPVVDGAGRWSVQSKSIAAEDIARAAPPVVQDFVPVEPTHVPPLTDSAPVAEPDFADIEAEIAFDESQLEIELGEIDLDLSDLGDADFAVSPAVMSELADADVVDDAPVAPRTLVTAAASAVPVEFAAPDYSSLPFDPSQIASEEDVVETIAEIDVPDVPVAHDEERTEEHPEYDIDLDAEMAQLFATATAPIAALQRSAPDGAIGFEPASARPQAALDLDEFERALEEDFRRSFTENRSSIAPDRVPLAPVSDTASDGGGRRSLLLMAGAAVAIIVFGGAGVYAYMSGDSPILTASTEPKIILADTEPVKIVPDEPGGKQVPNQNKAVYDRVSGDNSDQLKQESLLSSNEEPIDVVQRTLEPENLPMDDDSMGLATPTGDTIDPRLLPDEAEQDRVTTTNKVVSGVSPRKVKTMVVRADGSLVEREVTEEDLKQQASNDAELQKIAQKAALDAATASDSQADDIARTIDSVPERLAATDPASDDKSSRVTATVPEKVEPAEVTNVDPIDAARVDDQPAVADLPADDPAASVEKTELKPVEPSIAEENQQAAVDQTAVAEPVVAVDQSAVTKAADAEVEDAPVRKVRTTKIAPVPDVRPVDQDVNVVGTVTDQGTVQSQAEAKPQDVALADQATQSTVATAAVPAGSYVIQIASLPSETEAKTSYSRLSAKFSGIIGGRGVDIRRAEIKNKGTYYRVRIPAGSKQEAQALCSQYKAAGGSCLVSK